MSQGKKNAWERYLEYEIQDWDRFRIPHNRVLVEIDPQEYETTVGGILVVKDTNLAAHATRRGVVRKLPHSLVCTINEGTTMPWECDMDLQVGDEVYMTAQDSYNCYTFTYEDKVMKLVDYSGLLLAKRGEDIAMLNGYLLIEKVTKEVGFGAYKKEEEDPNFGIVHAVGKPNKRIKGHHPHEKKEVFVEDIQTEINIGDKIYIHDRTRTFDLEDFAHARFDNRKIYKVCSRRRVAAVVGS